MTLYRRIENVLTGGGQYLAGYFEIVDAPVLQRVTPEAMAELEGREADRVLVLSELGVRQISYAIGNWWVDHPMCRVDRPTTGWFIDLSTIPEVQQ